MWLRQRGGALHKEGSSFRRPQARASGAAYKPHVGAFGTSRRTAFQLTLGIEPGLKSHDYCCVMALFLPL